MVFRVLGDGKVLWQSKPLQAYGARQECNIEIRGVQQLTLEAGCSGNGQWGWAAWINPRVTPTAKSTPSSSKPAHPVLSYALKPHPHDAVKFGSHWYKFFPGKFTWDDAQRRCQIMGGYLACVETDAENNFVFKATGSNDTWLGGSKERGGAWRWVDGSLWKLSLWQPGQPDNGGGNEDALHLQKIAPTWNDLSRDSGLGFVCEWEF